MLRILIFLCLFILGYGANASNLLMTNVGGPSDQGFDLLASDTTCNSGTITFSNVSQLYKNLMLVALVRSDSSPASTVGLSVTINADGGANYDYEYWGLEAAGGTTVRTLNATKINQGVIPAFNASVLVPAIIEAVIPNYTGTTFYHSYESLNGHKTNLTTTNINAGGDWQSTAAITSLTVALTGGNYVCGSIVELYGLP